MCSLSVILLCAVIAAAAAVNVPLVRKAEDFIDPHLSSHM